MAKAHFIDLFAFLCSPMKLKLNFFQYVYWVPRFFSWEFGYSWHLFIYLFEALCSFLHLFSLLWFSLVYDLSIYFDRLWGLLKVYYKDLYGMIRAMMEILMIPPQWNFPPQALYEIEIVTLSVLLFMCKYFYLCICKSVNIFCIIYPAVSKLIILKLSSQYSNY